MPSPGVYSQKRIGELRREGVEIEISDDIGWLYYLGDQSEVDSSGLLGTMAGVAEIVDLQGVLMVRQAPFLGDARLRQPTRDAQL